MGTSNTGPRSGYPTSWPSTLAKCSPGGKRDPSTVMLNPRPLLSSIKYDGMVTQEAGSRRPPPSARAPTLSSLLKALRVKAMRDS